MPGVGSAKFNAPGGRLPPLSREAEEAVETSRRQFSPTLETSSAPVSRHKNKGFVVNQAYIDDEQAAKDMQVALRSRSDLALPVSNRKPKFLDDLENFLIRELHSLGVEQVQPNDTRLQAHREVFEYLIEDFKTYKPIFASIKNEYEMMLSHQAAYIKQLDPLQQMLVTVTEQCDSEVMRLRDTEKNDILELKRQNQRLQSIIDQIKHDQLALQIQVERLEQKLADQYDKYRSEANARKLLVSDINDLRTQQEELIWQQQQASSRDESEDPGLMRLALKKARANEKEASRILNDMIANYGDVIPKADHLLLQQQYKELQESVSEKAIEFDQLKEEHDSLLETHKQVIKQRDEYYQESERLRQMATPRPDWNRCGDVIAGGMQRWKELAQGKSSDELVSILLNELAGSEADNNTPDYFESKGTGDDVPTHLRLPEGVKVKNRRLGRRDASLLIKSVWREKEEFDLSQPPTTARIPLGEYLIQYLTLKFPSNPEMVTEWAYNLENACERYVHDDKIQLFYSVLNKKMDQELYFAQIQSVISLIEYLSKENEGHEPEGVFTVEELTKVLNTYFDGKITTDEIEKLTMAAQQELDDAETTDLEFGKLFFEDDEGKFGQFVDELKLLYSNTRHKYIADIMDALRKAELETVASADLTSAMSLLDPAMDADERQSTVLWVYGVNSKPDLDSALALNFEEVETRLHNTRIKRFF